MNKSAYTQIKFPFWYKIAPSFFQGLARLLIKPVLKYFTSLKIHGLDNIPTDGKPLIIAPNHFGELDPILIPLLFKFFSKHTPIYFVSIAKNEFTNSESFGIRKNFYGGLLFKLNGAYPLKRGSGNYKTSLKYHGELLKLGRTICIFPEGRISKDGLLQEAHGGTAFLAKEFDAHVIPLAITGTFGLTLKKFFRKEAQLEMTLAKALSYEELADGCDEEKENCYKHASENIMRIIKGILSKHNE